MGLIKRYFKKVFCPHPSWHVVAGSAISPRELWECRRCGKTSEVNNQSE